MPRFALKADADFTLREIRQWPSGVTRSTTRAMRAWGTLVRRQARQNASTMLRRRSGRGRRGIRMVTRVNGTQITTRVWPSVGYMSAHELGSHIPAVLIRPVRARVLRYQQHGETRFARFVHRPAFTLPKRPFLSAAYQTHAAQLQSMLDAGIQRFLDTGRVAR